MAKANSENNDLKKILTHLTALDKKVDKGFKEADKQFKEAAEFRQQTETNFAAINQRVDDGFKEAAEFRKKTENHFTGLNREILGIGSSLYDKIEGYHHEMQAGFKAAEGFQRKTEENFAGLYREIPEVGNMAYKHSDAYHDEFSKYQEQALVFQQETRAFIEKSEAFQNDVRLTIQDISRILIRIESKQIVFEETFKQLKAENEELKKAKVAHEATIKKLEQRVAILEAVQG